MDIRAIVAGTIALVALIGLIVLSALGTVDAVDKLDAIIGTALGLLFGLYSSPYTGPDAGIVEVDEPAGVTRANELGRVDPLGIIALGGILLWTAIVAGIVALVFG